MIKPFSQACANNSNAILTQLQRLLKNTDSVLEIGSGSGQHAVYFSESLPHLNWQTSDIEENHAGIHLWIDDCKSQNCLRPLSLDVDDDVWTDTQYPSVFTANTLHILSWSQVESLFQGLPNVMKNNGLFVAYGPFNYDGQYTSESNARFDQWLQASNAHQGIRDIERVNRLAEDHGLSWEEDIAMPANNRLQVWRYSA